MARRSILLLTFVVGLVGGGALATSWYSATAVTVESGSATASTRAIVVGGAHSVGTAAVRTSSAGGRWVLTESGTVTWISSDQPLPAGATSPTAQWYAERAREFAKLAEDLECQISGVGCHEVEDLNQGY